MLSIFPASETTVFISEEVIQNIKDDPVGGTLLLCNQIEAFAGAALGVKERHPVMLEALALISEIHEAKLLPFEFDLPELTPNANQDTSAIHALVKFLSTRCATEATSLHLKFLRSRFRTSLGSEFAYEFSQGDLDRVQELINDLREQIAKSNRLERDHQHRLLRRLEMLQRELHKKVSDLDRFWGLIGDAGVVLGKLGNDAKPIVDRIREVAEIVWRTQSRAEELPSGTHLPSLGHKPNPEDAPESEQA